MVRRIGAGLIGAGFAANIHANAYKRLPNVDVVAVYSRTAKRAEKFAKDHSLKAWYTDMDELLERQDIDVVSVAIPNYLHAQAALKAIEHGKHVIVEKPLTTTIEDADKVIEAAKKKGVKLMYAENILFSPSMRRAKEIIDEGAIGDILVVEARESHSGSHSPYALKKEYCGGGALMNLGVHPIGAALWLIDSPVDRVYAEMGNLYHKLEAEDHASLFIRFKNNSLATIHASYTVKGGIDDRVEMYGTDGSIYVDLFRVSPVKVYSEKGYSYVVEKATISTGWTLPSVDEVWQLGYEREIEHFVNCVINDEEPFPGGEFGKRVLEVVFAAYKSVEEKRPQRL
ncbi:MAG: hypothetical protein AYL32_006200 [Candidatus Bathyarchaeota archaeon B26-2]|nr:MAG: hypothetical protein AYL32_006200 [Candidatus Bathyarchaeota archaeon B26-2]